MEVEKNVDRALKGTDYLRPSALDNIMKWVCLISAPVFLVLGILMTDKRFIFAFIVAAGLSTFSGIWAGYPNKVWTITKHAIAKHAIIKDPDPTSLWSFRRKAAYWVFYGFAVSLFFFTLSYSSILQ